MSGIGHNGGPTLEAGAGFRRVAWKKARAELMPALPLEVVRLRVARAKRLGLPYRAYASIRARTGRDIVAFLFSGNALELRGTAATLPGRVAERVRALGPAESGAARLAAVYPPGAPGAVLAGNRGALDHAFVAPTLAQGWGETKARIAAALAEAGTPSDGVVLVAATALEQEWCTAGRLAGVVAPEVVFHPEPGLGAGA